MDTILYILFALSLNLDSFCTGLSYGAKSIRVPPLSLLITTLMSIVSVAVSMAAVRLTTAHIPASQAYRLGSALLMLTGLWVIFHNLRKNRLKSCLSQKYHKVKTVEIRLRPFGLIVQILKEPARADFDRSGAISPREALALGAALAMDAFAAGPAVSLLGFSVLVTALAVGLGHFLLTVSGLIAGRGISTGAVEQKLTILPGFILILLGFVKIS